MDSNSFISIGAVGDLFVVKTYINGERSMVECPLDDICSLADTKNSEGNNSDPNAYFLNALQILEQAPKILACNLG